ncbi:uncharacterized protein KQ657_000935 [Scheffersomyces spartinae]|uniref:Uncharacterized protein n=1 Tax=Scheffersomyces spartinae TaxID=45513 RepID=A0A9P7V985_9ASCO|nr:uncharacterized protein KQ657_000935 [Scheffersomyces spartinae]KAG7193178.1 hypothetical protein KQ657_000935 [Scheffersomyces spartinae]
MVPSPYGAVSGPPIKVRPGDPRLGGVLCGRCRGSGIVHFLLDEEMCPVCSGLGRIVNQPNGPPPMPPLPGQFPQQQPYQQPYQQQPYQHQQQQGYYQSPQQNHYGDYKR